MLFRLKFPIQVERPSDDLDETIAAEVELVCRGGKWQGICSTPPIATEVCDTLDEALKTVAREIIRDAVTANP